ncbi:MAG: toxin TcdB middle/N-terminal domain-containing protein, partial [Nanoarchaeota archaeon]
NTKLNNGSGWVAGIDWLSPEKFTDEGFNIGRRIADVNGDGYSDILVAYQGPPAEITTHIKNATSAYLLKKITNVYEGVTELNYSQSTNNNNSYNLGFNIWLIKNNSLNNSVGQGFGAGSIYSYSYVQGKFDYLTKEFRGFGNVNETNPDNSIITNFFHQDSILKGREFKREVYNSSGKILRANFNLYTNSSDGIIYLNETSTQIYDGENTSITHNSTFEYDFFSNIIKINDFGDKDVSGDEKYEVLAYYYNTSSFIVDSLANNTLFAADNNTIIKRTFYFYDNQTSGVRIGDLTKIKNFNNGQDPETQYTYDFFGNIISQIEPLGYTTSYTYDSTGTYRIKEVNALGHSIDFEYDSGTGNLLSEKRHGLNKSYGYDIFGRIKKEIVSPDTTSFPTKNYSYN